MQPYPLQNILFINYRFVLLNISAARVKFTGNICIPVRTTRVHRGLPPAHIIGIRL